MLNKDVKLAGVSFGDCQENIKKYAGHGVGNFQLVREPDNPHDQHAIKVALFGYYAFGYIPKHISRELAPLIDSGRRFEAEYQFRTESPYHDTVGLTVRIVEV